MMKGEKTFLYDNIKSIWEIKPRLTPGETVQV